MKARATRGLDPKVYAVNIGVHRLDGEALSDEELATIQAALAAEADALPPAPEATESGHDAPATPATGTGGE